MSADSLWIQLPLMIGIPVLVLWVIQLVKGASGAKRPGPENAVEVGMDYAVVATGACGSIFTNDTIYQTWGGIAVTTYGIVTILLCIVFIGVLARIRRWQGRSVGHLMAVRNIFLGLIPLGMVTAILIVGYTINPRR